MVQRRNKKFKKGKNMNAHKRRKMKIYNMIFGNKQVIEESEKVEVVAEAAPVVQEATVEETPVVQQIEEVKTTTKKRKSTT
jgi:hypothetical protein